MSDRIVFPVSEKTSNLLRRGSPVVTVAEVSGFTMHKRASGQPVAQPRTRLVVVGIDLTATEPFHGVEKGDAVVAAATIAGATYVCKSEALALDLESETGRAHLAWWALPLWHAASNSAAPGPERELEVLRQAASNGEVDPARLRDICLPLVEVAGA